MKTLILIGVLLIMTSGCSESNSALAPRQGRLETLKPVEASPNREMIQEGHGGDTNTLAFVKIARAAHQIMVNQNYSKGLTNVFEKLVNETDVETTPIYPASWPNLSCEEKFDLVVRTYFSVVSISVPQALRSLINQTITGHCEDSYRIKVDPPKNFSKATEPQVQFNILTESIINLIRQNVRENRHWSVFYFCASPAYFEDWQKDIVFRFISNQLKDGLNQTTWVRLPNETGHISGKVIISVKKKVWDKLLYSEKLELVLHEYLGITSFDPNYVFSSKLFLALRDL